MEKTKVKLINDPYQCSFHTGDVGYVDGYVRGGDDRAYAVVVCKGRIDMVPMNALAVLDASFPPESKT